jgi:hypothetical protein
LLGRLLNNPSDGLLLDDHGPPHIHVFSADGEAKLLLEGGKGMASGWSKAEMDKEIDRALARGRRLTRGEPRAASARYDRRTRRMVVELTNGCSFVFPPRALQGLARAGDAALADVEILGLGQALHWPKLDADFTVPGLLMGVFGTRAWMASELARHAGQSTSPAKAAAARLNGRKGGRPRRKAA